MATHSFKCAATLLFWTQQKPAQGRGCAHINSLFNCFDCPLSMMSLIYQIPINLSIIYLSKHFRFRPKWTHRCLNIFPVSQFWQSAHTVQGFCNIHHLLKHNAHRNENTLDNRHDYRLYCILLCCSSLFSFIAG